MYPTVVSFERDLKLLESPIPPYRVSIHTLQLQHHIMIPTPVKPTNFPTSDAEHEDSHKKKTKGKRSSHDKGLVQEKAPGQDQRHAGSGYDIETLRNGSFGSGSLGIGFLSQYPLQIMDGFTVDVSNGGEYQRKGADNTMDAVTAAARKHKRMIKNRESAARSRARKQAYTSQLEIEVAELKEENASLKRRRKVLEDISDAEPAYPKELPQKSHSAGF